jgi:hypothetical protein
MSGRDGRMPSIYARIEGRAGNLGSEVVGCQTVPLWRAHGLVDLEFGLGLQKGPMEAIQDRVSIGPNLRPSYGIPRRGGPEKWTRGQASCPDRSARTRKKACRSVMGSPVTISAAPLPTLVPERCSRRLPAPVTRWIPPDRSDRPRSRNGPWRCRTRSRTPWRSGRTRAGPPSNTAQASRGEPPEVVAAVRAGP